MNHHVLVTLIGFGVTYPMDSDLSARTHFFYPYFEQLGTVLEHTTLITQVKKTRDWALIVSPFLTSDLEQYEQEGGAGMFFLEDSSLGLHILPFWQSLLHSKSTANTSDETLTQEINSKQSNFRIKVLSSMLYALSYMLMLSLMLYG